MAQFTRPQAHSIFTLVLAGVLALGLSRTGMADPWMAFMADTGLFDTGSPVTDDTGSPGDPSDSGGSPGDDTGAPGGGDDTGEPGGGDDTGEPGGSDDTGEPSGGDDSGEPGGGDDTGEPSGDDTGEPSSDDTGTSADTGDSEVEPEPIDTGGKSAAELAGEKGGCGCASSNPPSGMVVLMIALGLVARRRSVS